MKKNIHNYCFGNISFLGKEVHNLGDNLQLLAIDNIYKRMGILSNITYIPYEQLSSWKSIDGRKVILPINFPFLEYQEKGICGLFSEDIIPVFLGFTYINNSLTNDEIMYLKKYEPIGCRDEYTYRNLKKNGIDVWLNGCMSLCLNFMFGPRTLKTKKTYLVDICDEIRSFIPSSLKQNCAEVSQIQSLPPKINIKEYIKKWYENYYNDASVVITSRLHCAIPCIAMGIPVILAVSKVSFRFSWMERLLPIYTSDKFEFIDWHPSTQNYNYIQDLIMRNAIYHITKVNSHSDLEKDITEYYLNRKKSHYIVEGYTETMEFIKAKWKKQDRFYFSFWGISIISEMIYQYLKEHYPNAKMLYAFDKYKHITFHGHNTINIYNITSKTLNDIWVFVTASAASKEAREYFYKISHTEYFLSYSEFINSSGTEYFGRL